MRWLVALLLGLSACATRPARSFAPPPMAGQLKFHFVDVGTGACTIVECSDPAVPPMVVDCGSAYRRINRLRRARVRAYAREVFARHSTPPDLVLTHPHSDHYSLIPDIMQPEEPGAVYFGGRLESYERSPRLRRWLREGAHDLPNRYAGPVFPDKLRRIDCAHDDRVLDVAVVAVNTPPADRTRNPNSSSLALYLRYGRFSALLPGDATGATEAAMVERFRAHGVRRLDVTLLAASHHGSFTHESNGAKWAAFARPRAIVYSSGAVHGHPRCESVARYTDPRIGGARLLTARRHEFGCGAARVLLFGWPNRRTSLSSEYSTRKSGTIVVTTDGRSMGVTCSGSDCGLVGGRVALSAPM